MSYCTVILQISAYEERPLNPDTREANGPPYVLDVLNEALLTDGFRDEFLPVPGDAFDVFIASMNTRGVNGSELAAAVFSQKWDRPECVVLVVGHLDSDGEPDVYTESSVRRGTWPLEA